MQLDPTLASYFEGLYRPHRLTGKSVNTVRLYRVCLRQLERYLERPALLADLSDDTIRGVMCSLVESGRAIPTANKCRSHLTALWNFLARKGLVDTWPDVMPLIEPTRCPIAWMRPELLRLWQACEASTGEIGGAPAPLWWHSLHAIGWDSGERISAITGLAWNDVDLAGGWARFAAEVRKGKRSDLLCRLHADTVVVLVALKPYTGADRLVLPWDKSPTLIWRHYRLLRRRAGLPDDRAHAFHCLRKSVASYFEAAGGNSTKLLGHSNRRVTERYLDLRIVGQQHASDVLFRPDQPQPP